MNSCERRLRRWLIDSICVRLSATCVASSVASHCLSTRHTTPAWQSHSRGARWDLFCSGQRTHMRDAACSMFTAVSDIVARPHTRRSIKDGRVGTRGSATGWNLSTGGARHNVMCPSLRALFDLKDENFFKKKPNKSKSRNPWHLPFPVPYLMRSHSVRVIPVSDGDDSVKKRRQGLKPSAQSPVYFSGGVHTQKPR